MSGPRRLWPFSARSGLKGVNRAIALGDWNAVKAARGIGPKTAQRVVNELKDKAPKVMAMGGHSGVWPLVRKTAEPGVGQGANQGAGADDDAGG